MMQLIPANRIAQHCIVAPIVIMVALWLVWLLSIDRADPLSLEHAEMSPNPAYAGQYVTARWSLTWGRRCEGETSREIVGSDDVIRAYAKEATRMPSILGRQRVDKGFTLPASLPPGPAIYRAIMRFPKCGITSAVWPLTVRAPDTVIEIVAK